MNRSFSPQNNFSSSPRGFQNHFRMQPSQHNQSYQQRMQFRSPNSSPSFPHNNNYNSPNGNVRHKNDFVSLGNEFSSPRFHSSPMNYSPRSVAPYKSNNSSFNNSWNNRSSGKSRNSSSYFADVSGSPYSMKNKNQKFQSKQNQDSQNDSNPGHSNNIEDYIHPSMLEDPWKNDMILYEKNKNLKKKEDGDTSS